jgi:polyphosphate kinase
MVPVDDPSCRKKLMNTLLVYFQDTSNSWEMQPDGSYCRRNSGDHPVRAQELLYEQACRTMEQIRQSRRTTFETHKPQDHK